jgi:hypothetical protein
MEITKLVKLMADFHLINNIINFNLFLLRQW